MRILYIVYFSRSSWHTTPIMQEYTSIRAKSVVDANLSVKTEYIFRILKHSQATSLILIKLHSGLIHLSCRVSTITVLHFHDLVLMLIITR